MERYEFTAEQRRLIEEMRPPFIVCQFLGNSVETLAVSAGFCELFGFKDREQIYADMNRNMFQDVHPDDTARFMNGLLRFAIEDGRLELTYRIRKKDGTGYRTILANGERVTAEGGARLGQIWFTDGGDAAEDAESETVLRESAGTDDLEKSIRYDQLTGLPNMTFFFERAEHGRKTLLDQGESPALLYIDLSGMKSYNHKYGFSEGDKLLRVFARLLSQTFRSENCSHINADRFAVIAKEDGLEDRLNGMFREWRQTRTRLHLPVSVGIYLNRTEEVAVGLAYDRAKIACDALNGTYASAFKYYDRTMSEEIDRQREILENFERALSEKWIQVYYQPILRAINGKVCDEEALSRWVDPVRGQLPPSSFIPFLEDAGLIYRLDLYVLEQVLEDIHTKQAEGFHIVPHSINLSRSDFDACDMVEEIRKRVDAAGVPRDRISIEITESVIGSNFEFIKGQIERFQALGFPVWMDDFGSGYSSLDVLQSIKFNLLKFDMGFMQRLDGNDDGKTILTELMKMASALGVDTICEGVETEEQVKFLQEIGCSKLQGFYFSRPLPFGVCLDYHREHRDGYENPKESDYFEAICGLNLYDIGVISREENQTLRNTYSTLPMCIIEIQEDKTRFVRTNKSYRKFFRRYFGISPTSEGNRFMPFSAGFMQNVVKTCCGQGSRTFYDEKMPDGSIIHAFARRISVNPVTGVSAVAIAVLSIREPSETLMLEEILSVIEQFGEHLPGGFFIYRAGGDEELLYANKAVCDIFGCESLQEFREQTGFTFRGMVHPEDYERVSASISEQIWHGSGDLDYVEYRIVRKDGGIRWIDDYGQYIEYDSQNKLFYVFISDVTDKHEQAESDKALRSAVIEALTKMYDSVWLITDIEQETFELFRVDPVLVHSMPANAARKIRRFTEALAFYSRLVLEEDRAGFLEATSPENITRNTADDGVYSVPFRRVFEDGTQNYRIEFTRLNLPGGKTGIVAGFKNGDVWKN